GSYIDGKACGSFGDFGILSFNGNKIITTSGGGALLSNNTDALQKARFLATQAKENTPHYEHLEMGYNYRMSNIAAAIGVGQLKVLDKRVAARRANHDFYFELLSGIKGIQFLEEPTGYFSNRWLSCITIDPLITGVSREDLRLALEKENIESRPLWKPMHMQPLFENCDYYGTDFSEKLFKDGICLPSGSNLTPQEKERISSQLKVVFSC
ncbi:MAG: DegT/DnrJ/EryC1/StrS family aminotransferase, partial [Candidatus Arcticimaribacter sp.]